MNTTQTETDLLPALLALHAHGVTTILGAITLALAHRKGATTPRDVAEIVTEKGGGTSKGNLTGTFDTLEGNGLIVTGRDVIGDRRFRRATATPSGALAIEDASNAGGAA